MRDIQDTRNIQKHKTKYIIRKYKDGKHNHLGCGETLIEALMIRDWCKANDWKPFPSKPRKYIYNTSVGTYQIVKNFVEDGGYKIHCFGTYKSLEDAMVERDRLVEVDWDLDAWCDLG